MDMHSSTETRQKRPAMTNAERQRRHREKARNELQALREIEQPQHDETELLRRIDSLAAQLAKATKEHQAAQARITAMAQAAQGEQALREGVVAMLRALSPAARCAATAHLKQAGVWDSLPMAPATPPQPERRDAPASWHFF